MNSSRFNQLLLVLTALALNTSTSNATTPYFVPLGFAPNGGFASEARGISDDGLVVVGASQTAQGFAGFRWTRARGMRLIDGSASPYVDTTAYGVSPDGNWVVGLAFPSGGDFNAYRWSEATGLDILPDLPGDFDIGYAEAASFGGEVVVGIGIGESGYVQPTYWDANGNVHRIGNFEGNATFAADVSADGRIIVGQGVADEGSLRAFRWTNEEGILFLEGFPSASSTQAVAVSLDGGTIAGLASVGSTVESFLWTDDFGITRLTSIDRADTTYVMDLSGDGSMCVGYVFEFNVGADAVVWRNGKIQILQQMLEEEFGLGNSLSGWKLLSASSISGNGRAITGYGVNPQGNQEAWVVYLPEPSSLTLWSLFAMGLGLFLICKRHNLVLDAEFLEQ